MADLDPRAGLPYECDLVMKGGITSGVVYPTAIADIAADHRLRSIGGSSAGAIAAAAAAAAELGRYSENGGFEALRQLPGRLGQVDASGRTLLQRLFQAQPATADAFDLFWTWRSAPPSGRVRAAVAAVRRHGRTPWWWHLVGFLIVADGVALFVASASSGESWGVVGGCAVFVIGLVLWVLGAIVGQIAMGGIRLARATRAGVDGNHLGVCTGRTAPGSSTPGLTDWLHGTIQELAGRTGRDDPVVTYGDLAGVGIDLVTMVTDLTHGTPEPFPLTTRAWAFDERDMRALFPDAVVHHLVREGAPPADDPAFAEALAANRLHALPPPEQLPILLGARMSLSFPVLISAVPLYAWSPKAEPDASGDMELVRSWFSDGGITSNLPVHLFDKPLPRRPTYAINLGGGGDGLPPAERIRRPLTAQAGQRPPTRRIESTVQLGSALFDTMQNWSDNSLIRAPGYRDRICTVRLAAGEGGMNLDMPPATIAGLSELGVRAGQNLAWIQRGGDEPANQWPRHRFTRYRTFLGGLSRYLGDAAGRFGDTYAALARAAVKDTTLPYRSNWTLRRATAVEKDLATIFATDRHRMEDGAPAGSALAFDARVRPAVSSD